MHIGAHGNVNRYGSPIELLILPGINVLVAVLLYFIPRIDPKRANIMASMPAYRWIRLSVAGLLTYVFCITLSASLHPGMNFLPWIAVGILGMFLALGLALPQVKQNHMIGIRLPWTLESEENWCRTHEFAGKWWVRGSLAGIVLALVFTSISFFIAFGVLIALVISTMIYSYRIFKQESASPK